MMRVFLAAAAALTVPLAPAIAQDAAPAGTEAAKPEKITDKSHPDYIRCRSEPVIGSRAKKRRVCLTNREWEEFGRRGNDVARRTVEENASGMTTN